VRECETIKVLNRLAAADCLLLLLLIWISTAEDHKVALLGEWGGAAWAGYNRLFALFVRMITWVGLLLKRELLHSAACQAGCCLWNALLQQLWGPCCPC
jgi:hypothetical protein